MDFGSYNFSTLRAIQGIAFRTLEQFTATEIVKTGFKVSELLTAFKKSYPDKVVKQVISGGLLGDGSTYTAQLNDFEIARLLVETNDPAMRELVKGAKGLPVLMAYLSVITIGKELPPENLLESALPFAIASLSVEGEVAKLWNQNLQTEMTRLAPLASNGLKFQKGRKQASLGPLALAVRRRLERSPNENAATIWIALSGKPPHGLKFCDNKTGKYVEYDKRTHSGSLKNTGYPRFSNIVTEQRKKLRS